MQIILLDKVVNLGNLGEVVRVKDGYARNFLIRPAAPVVPRMPPKKSLRPSAPSSKKRLLPSWPNRKPWVQS